MIARPVRALSSLVAVLLAAACTNSFEIPIETPIRPKLDVAAFQRVLVAGFIAGGTEDVDGNLETTRLLRSQLRTKSQLRVIDSDVLPLVDVASEGRDSGGAAHQRPPPIKEEKDLEAYEHVFANVDYWKKIGEEYQQPLIVTGTVMFTPLQRNSIVQREQEVYDSFGRRRVVPVRTVHGAQRLQPRRALHLHRRAQRRNAPLGKLRRADPLQRQPDDAGVVVVFRADGSAHPDVPQHAQQPENQGHSYPAAVTARCCPGRKRAS